MNIAFHPLKLAPRHRASVALLTTTLAAPLSIQAATFNSGSTGADGALNPQANIEIPLPESGILNYTTVNIPSGVTVTFKKNTLNTPVYMLASGNVTIAGSIDLRGKDAKPTGTYGDGAVGDDGVPGAGGPGGYDGGRGGREDASQRVEIIRGGAGLGPGGGAGGIEGGDGCSAGRYYKYIGAGGGYATDAYTRYVASYCSGSNLIPLGKSYGSALLQPLLGGSGGGGGRGGTTYAGSGGGGGGGAILIASSGTLTVTGTIDTTGGDGGGIAGPGAGGQGAGGSGGAIRLIANTIAGGGGLYANGGCVNYNNSRRQFCGSDGGNSFGGASGRIRLEPATNITFSGASSPAYVKDVPGPVFIADSPSLRIASVAGQTVPPNPTGSADVTLPASTTGPIDVVFETTNIPVGNTVTLRLAPAYGQPTEVLSPAISGTTASGSATVKVTLPSGPSTLQATTSYTIVIAGSVDLSRFAQNETVEKVEVTVPLVGEARARLLTASGKAYEVPYATLRAAGFQG